MTASVSGLDRAVRVALGFWLVGWMVKAAYLLDLFGRVGMGTTLVVDGMPEVLWHPFVALAAYVIPLAAIPLGIVRGGRVAAACAAVGALCSLALLLHVSAYNDATFVTAFWAGLWITWLATRGDVEAEAWGPRLAQGLLALTFLGGTLGKLTPEYLSGEVLYHVYFLQKQTLFYPWLRDALDPEALRSFATVFSWGVIGTEAALATSVFWRPRIALWACAAVCTAMVAGSTVYLASVMAPLVGVCAGGLLVRGMSPAASMAWGRQSASVSLGIGRPS